MLLIIEYKGKKIRASMQESYKVITEFNEEQIILDQCRNCGQWCSEDDEFYGEGYCTHCAVMCESCQNYFCYTDMIKDKDAESDLICRECHGSYNN